MVDRFPGFGNHISHDIGPHLDVRLELVQCRLRCVEQLKDIERRRPLGDALQDRLARLLIEVRELGVTPPLAKKADQRAPRTALDVHVFDVPEKRKLEDVRDATSALLAATAADAPLAARDTLILGEVEKGVVEPVHHLLDNARLNLVVQSIEGEISRGAHDVESSVKIVGPVGEDKSACVDEAENEVKRGRSERGRGEREAERLTGLRRRAPCDECVVKVRGTGDEDEAVSREDGCGAFVRGRGAFDGDVHVRLEPGAPHEDQVFPELIDPVLFRIALFAMLRRVEEKLECLSEALAGVEVLELFGEESRIDGGLEAEDSALVCGGDG